MDISLDISIPYYNCYFKLPSFVTFNKKSSSKNKRMPDMGLEPWALWLQARLQNHHAK